MNRSIRNTASVLAVTALTALAVFAGVEVSSRVVGGTAEPAGYSASAYVAGYAAQNDPQGDSLVCPATGCTASSCHGATGGSRQ